MPQLFVWNTLEIQLLPEKVAFVEVHQLLLISDWHLGKLGHFRQEGLFVPPMQLKQEFERLAQLIHNLDVRKVVFLGDLFHSSWNSEWDEFNLFLAHFPDVEFILTKGNHDILPKSILAQSILRVVDHVMLGEDIILAHEPKHDLPKNILQIVGHIHPGTVIRSKGRQRFRLPCFFLQDNILTLPAFGKWTGLYLIAKTPENRLFAVVHDAVLEIK